MVLEAISAHVEEAMCKLLKSLSAAIIITPDMMKRVSRFQDFFFINYLAICKVINTKHNSMFIRNDFLHAVYLIIF